MAHAQKPDFVFRRNWRVHLIWRGRQFSRVPAAKVCASAVLILVMLDTPCSEVMWRVLATHSIRQFSPSLPLPCVTVCHHISVGLYEIRHIYRTYASLSNTEHHCNLQQATLASPFNSPHINTTQFIAEAYVIRWRGTSVQVFTCLRKSCS